MIQLLETDIPLHFKYIALKKMMNMEDENSPKIQEWIDVCSQLTSVSLNDYITMSEGFKADFNLLTADPSTIHKLGWEPCYDIYQLAQDIIDSKNAIDK
jgi:hypothetical protein